MKLFTDFIKVFRSTGGSNLYIGMTIVKLLLAWITSTYITALATKNIFDEDFDRILYVWLVVETIEYIWWLFIEEPLERRVSLNMRRDFLSFSNQEYEKLNTNTKERNPMSMYKRKKNNAINSLVMCITWGIPAVCGLITSLIYLVNAFWDYRIASTMVIFVMCIVVFLLRKKIYKIKAMQKERREKEEKLSNTVQCSEPRFETGDQTAEEFTDHEIALHMVGEPVRHMRMNFNMVLAIGNIVVLWVITHSRFDSVTILLNLIRATKHLQSSTRSCSWFFNNYVDNEQKWMEYVKFWEKNNGNQKSDPPQEVLPDTITVLPSTVENEDFSVTVPNPFSFHQGNDYLVRGPSGHGKSTFIKALIGKLPGLTLLQGDPASFLQNYVEYYQNIREKLPWSKVTLDQLFNSTDSDLIKQSCEMVGLTYWLDRFIDGTTNEVDFEKEINQSISGGEKSRLALAIKASELIRDPTKRAYILDEPEQGIDPALAYEVVGRILEEFPDRTAIIISHLEVIEDKFQWDGIIRVKDGMINFEPSMLV